MSGRSTSKLLCNIQIWKRSASLSETNIQCFQLIQHHGQDKFHKIFLYYLPIYTFFSPCMYFPKVMCSSKRVPVMFDQEHTLTVAFYLWKIIQNIYIPMYWWLRLQYMNFRQDNSIYNLPLSRSLKFMFLVCKMSLTHHRATLGHFHSNSKLHFLAKNHSNHMWVRVGVRCSPR